MKHTLTELTAIIEQLVLDNGTEAVMNCLQTALCNRSGAAEAEWTNRAVAADIRAEWRRQACAVSRAIFELYA